MKNPKCTIKDGNRLGQITSSSLVLDLAHDLAGRRTTLSYPNIVSTSYAYNEASFLTGLVARDSQQTTINSFTYTPDGMGNRTSMTDLAGEHNYTYDNTYQLTQATHPNMPTEQFGYDAVGSRTSSGEPTPGLSTTLYAYDFENRLTDVSFSDMVVHYKYDPFGRRIEKNVDGTITKYVYDGPNIVTQYDGDWNVQAKYLFTLDIDDPLMVQQGDNVYYYHKDGLGSVVNLTDSSQSIVKGYTYKSFGDIYAETGSVVQPFTFTGREYDPESGLYYYRARYYDPRAGWFLTKDPIGFAGGDVNLYRYVWNSPTNWIDPWGFSKTKGIKRGEDEYLRQLKETKGDRTKIDQIERAVKQQRECGEIGPERWKKIRAWIKLAKDRRLYFPFTLMFEFQIQVLDNLQTGYPLDYYPGKIY